MGFGAAAFAGPFRRYSIATLLLVAAAGGMTSLEAPGVGANLPTPWIGVWERVDIGAWLIWIAVLAARLLAVSRNPTPVRRETPRSASW
jgi:hypothetical protein